MLSVKQLCYVQCGYGDVCSYSKQSYCILVDMGGRGSIIFIYSYLLIIHGILK